MEENLSGTLAIDLGNTNTVIAFQDQKNINPVLVEIPKITSTPGVIPTAIWFEETSKILKIGVDANDLARRGESLIRKSTNRYLTTVKIAFRAKQRRFDDFDGLLDESTIKPVQRSIIELSDEQDQPDLLPG